MACIHDRKDRPMHPDARTHGTMVPIQWEEISKICKIGAFRSSSKGWRVEKWEGQAVRAEEGFEDEHMFRHLHSSQRFAYEEICIVHAFAQATDQGLLKESIFIYVHMSVRMCVCPYLLKVQTIRRARSIIPQRGNNNILRGKMLLMPLYTPMGWIIKFCPVWKV